MVLPYRQASNVDAGIDGWRFIPSDLKPEQMEFVPSEGAYASKGGRLESPALACVSQPYAFYRLRFQTRWAKSGYYAVFFQDQAGLDQVDDIYGGVEASSEWTRHEYCFRSREHAAAFRMQWVSHGPLAVREVTVEPVDRTAVCAWADGFYATLPPTCDRAVEPCGDALPRTMRRLHDGGAWRVVMLGDSIINDTNNSNWDALLARRYPQSQLQIITSVRGATGCWHYREKKHLQTYVLDRRPDLLIIGGISHRKDLPAIRDVITQTRAARDCEILLMSGPMGPDWRDRDEADLSARLPASTYAGDPFNDQLAELAKETNVAFLDMNTSWGRYLGKSQASWRWFHRDAVHANDRGKQILGRLLEQYFTAEV